MQRSLHVGMVHCSFVIIYTCKKLTAMFCGAASRPQGAPSHKAVGGMPYSLPMALLQMDAEPGSLTSFSSQPWEEGAFADDNLHLAHSPQV